MLDRSHKMREELDKELRKIAFKTGFAWGVVVSLSFIVVAIILFRYI